jgi:hypothetical protein
MKLAAIRERKANDKPPPGDGVRQPRNADEAAALFWQGMRKMESRNDEGEPANEVFGEADRPTVMPLDPPTMAWLVRNDLFASAFRLLERGTWRRRIGFSPSSWKGQRTIRPPPCGQWSCLPGMLSQLGSPRRLVSPYRNSSSCR